MKSTKIFLLVDAAIFFASSRLEYHLSALRSAAEISLAPAGATKLKAFAETSALIVMSFASTVSV